jgi:hypothetical protein
MGVSFAPGGAQEIPNLSNYLYTTDGSIPDDSFSDASQSMDELLDRNNSLGEDETFFESLDEGALDDMKRSQDKASTGDDKPTLGRLQMEFLQMEECRVSQLGGASVWAN